MRRSYSAAGTFLLSLSRLDIGKPPGDIHRWRRTNLVVTGLWLLAFVQSPAGSGVSITRQRGVSLDASTRSSSSGTSMSISSNPKLKAALTWAGHTAPAVALFSRPTSLSSSRSARVILSRRWQPGMAHLTGTLLGIPPILHRQLKEGVSGMRAACSASTFISVAEWEQSLHPGSPGHRLAHRKGP